ncbi:hypothetical protein [Chryseobacterium hagamense]|uniref:Uncharacterized protein n=1 Tax=Chryseobacterium hagamense TaxID=395935 RepID=A0A511YSU7_9FLAO|nr:hypothetical protein [Chryseobacterium hagamense]GEN78252.1 hypothetical protein CHA01nite_39920 [Chryseobacterium hagamense]
MSREAAFPLPMRLKYRQCFRISSAALLNDDTVAIKGKDLLKKFEAIQEMNEEDKALFYQVS